MSICLKEDFFILVQFNQLIIPDPKLLEQLVVLLDSCQLITIKPIILLVLLLIVFILIYCHLNQFLQLAQSIIEKKQLGMFHLLVMEDFFLFFLAQLIQFSLCCFFYFFLWLLLLLIIFFIPIKFIIKETNDLMMFIHHLLELIIRVGFLLHLFKFSLLPIYPTLDMYEVNYLLQPLV